MTKKQGKTFIDIRLAEDWQFPERIKRIRITDVAVYFAYEAPNFTSGCRTLAGITGDWRYIDIIAHDCLEYFKSVNVKGMRREGRRLGLTPKF
jgi:hypothetical protein